LEVNYLTIDSIVKVLFSKLIQLFAEGDDMGLTVRKALTLDCLAKAKLVAGHLGLDREIKFVNIMEVPEVVRWMKGGELLLTSGYALPEGAEARKKLIRSMAKKGVAAFAIKLGYHLEEIPRELIDTANEVNLPLLALPKELPYMDIMVPVTEELLNMQVARLKRYEVIHNRLLSVLLAGGGFEDLCRSLNKIVNNPVLILDRNGSCLAECFGEEDELREPVLNELRGSCQSLLELQANRLHQIEMSLGDKVQPLALVLIKVNDKVNGALVVIGHCRPFDEDTLRTIEYAGPIVALVFAKEQAVFEAQRQLKGDFLEELVTNTFNDEELMEKRALSLNFNVQEPLTVFVLELDRRNNYYGAKTEQERQALKEFIWQKLHQSFTLEGNVMLQVKSSSIVGLASIKSEQELRQLQKTLTRLIKQVKQKQFRDCIAVGIGRPYTGVRNVSKSYQEALTAIKVGQMVEGAGQVSYFEDLGPYRLLYELRGSEDMQSFHQEVVGKIKLYDSQNNMNLMETLEHYFASDGNLRNTAEALHMHKNSVIYRIKKIEEITGLDLRDAEDRFNLQLGVKLDKII
jgi:purine catabolism regulator